MTHLNNENVVYSITPDDRPAIRFRAIPSDCSGVAATLGDARATYRAELINRLGVGRRDLPPVIEHVEAVVHGMWVREKIGAVHRDHYADRMFLQALLAPGAAQDRLRAHVENAAHCGTDPVVVLVEPDEPVAAVLDQMTPHDAVVVAYSDPDDVVGWAAMYGESVVGAPAAVPTRLTPSMPVGELGTAQSLRVPVDLLATLPQAS
jgi:hypothetical protein